MKPKSEKPPPEPIPRLNSLLHRLQHAPGQGDESFLDQLMIFLDNPPSGIANRWVAGAAMCSGWGIACSDSSVWRLFQSHAVVWRLRLALESGTDRAETPERLEEKTTELVAARTCEILANPHSPPSCLISLARIELRKQALEFARQKHADSQRLEIDRAYDILETKAFMNREAQFAIDQLKIALKHPKTPSFFEALQKELFGKTEIPPAPPA